MRRGRVLAARAAVMATALLAGCTSMAPPYERPSAPVAGTYPGEPVPGAPAIVPAAEMEWQQFFTDPRLKALIQIALRNNRDLRVAVLNIEQARAQYQIQRSFELPTVTLGATGLAEPDTSGSGTSACTTPRG